MLQRPLVGETLGIDLVNTQWSERGEAVDWLDSPDAAAHWLLEYGFDADNTALRPLLSARAAIRDHLDAPGPQTEENLNAILAHGAERPVLRAGSVQTERTADRGWDAAWSAARAFVHVVSTQPDRVRQCMHPDCTLYFFDTSRNGTRRWHSMDTCGARAKSARHYRRSNSGDTG